MKYLLVLIVVVGLLFTSCASVPSDSQAQPTTDAQAQPAASDNATPTAQSTTPAAQTAQPTTPSVTSELEKIMERQLDLEYGVVYSFTAQGPYAGPASTIANYVAGLEKMRFDTIMDGYETRSYMFADSFTMCNKSFDGKWVCSTSNASDVDDTTTQSESPAQSTVEMKEELDQYVVEKLPDKTIINIKTSCYKVGMSDGSVEYCYSADAVPLYIKSLSTDSEGQTYITIMEATSFMKSVPDSYFELPAGYVQSDAQGGPTAGQMSQAEIDALMAQYATE